MEKAMSKARLPKTDSIQELAQFWDSHDLTEFEDELEVVEEPLFERDAAITLHLSLADMDALHRVANARGVAEVELIRQWIQEKIHVD
jgi:predicted DNA binding CopG/RHH family protein